VVDDAQNPSSSWLKQQPSQVHQLGLAQLQFWLSCGLNQLKVKAAATLELGARGSTTQDYN